MQLQFLKKELPYRITIEQVSNGGWLCTVGCETFVYTNSEAGIVSLMADLRKLLENPGSMVRQYLHERSYWERHNPDMPGEPPKEPTHFRGLDARYPEPPQAESVSQSVPFGEPPPPTDIGVETPYGGAEPIATGPGPTGEPTTWRSAAPPKED